MDDHEDWCGVSANEARAVGLALEGLEEELSRLELHQLEDAALALGWCCQAGCPHHDDKEARELLERVIERKYGP